MVMFDSILIIKCHCRKFGSTVSIYTWLPLTSIACKLAICQGNVAFSGHGIEYQLTPLTLGFGVSNDDSRKVGLLICPSADWLAGIDRPTASNSGNHLVLNAPSHPVTYIQSNAR